MVIFHNGFLKLRLPRVYLRCMYKLIENHPDKYSNVSHIVRVGIITLLRKEGIVDNKGVPTFPEGD